MKEKIIKPILKLLLMWLSVMLIVIALGVIIGIPALILSYFGTSALAGVFLFLYITFIIAGFIIFCDSID